jgi:hypothetical protein
VDTILHAASTKLKMGSPDGYTASAQVAELHRVVVGWSNIPSWPARTTREQPVLLMWNDISGSLGRQPQTPGE